MMWCRFLTVHLRHNNGKTHSTFSVIYSVRKPDKRRIVEFSACLTFFVIPLFSVMSAEYAEAKEDAELVVAPVRIFRRNIAPGKPAFAYVS